MLSFFPFRRTSQNKDHDQSEYIVQFVVSADTTRQEHVGTFNLKSAKEKNNKRVKEEKEEKGGRLKLAIIFETWTSAREWAKVYSGRSSACRGKNSSLSGSGRVLVS